MIDRILRYVKGGGSGKRFVPHSALHVRTYFINTYIFIPAAAMTRLLSISLNIGQFPI